MIEREQVVREMERTDRAEEAVEALLTALRCMVEAFDPDIYRMATTQFGKAKAADWAHQRARGLIEQIESKTKQQSLPLVFKSPGSLTLPQQASVPCAG